MAQKLDQHSVVLYSALDPDLKRVIDAAVADDTFTDFILVETFRSNAAQNRDYANKKSNARAGESPHNFFPCFAFDFAPVRIDRTIDWRCTSAFVDMAKRFQLTSTELGITLTGGYSWTYPVDDDHIELTDWRHRAAAQIAKSSNKSPTIKKPVVQIPAKLDDVQVSSVDALSVGKFQKAM